MIKCPRAKVESINLGLGGKAARGQTTRLHGGGTVLRVETREWKTGSFTSGFLPTLQSSGTGERPGQWNVITPTTS